MRRALGLALWLATSAATASTAVAAPASAPAASASALGTGRVTSGAWTGRVAAPGAVDDAAIAERAARAFLAAHLSELAPGTDAKDFVVVANRVDDGKRTVAFAQQWNGMRVVGGQVAVVIARNGATTSGATTSGATTSGATTSGASGATGATGATIFAATTQAVPYVALALGPEVAERGDVVIVVDGRPRVAQHRVERRGHDEWDVYTRQGVELARENRTRYAELRFDVPVRWPGGGRMALPASEADVIVDGVPETTDANGTFTDGAQVEVRASGPRVQVVDAASATLTVMPTTLWAVTEPALDAQLSAFVHVVRGKAKARQLLPSLAWLDQPLAVYVNEAGSPCNALAQADALHFSAGTAQCENTARLADVVYHELGHSVHRAALIEGMGGYNAALSEGLADVFAASITGDPVIGRGLAYTDAGLRDLDPYGYERRSPEDLSPSQHQSGLIVSGALWDLRTRLIADHGEAQGIARAERLFVGVLQRAPNIAGSYMAARISDDDDANLANGTPNQCAIDDAFARHGLAPGITATTLGPLITDGAAISLARVAGTACAAPTIVSARAVLDGSVVPLAVTDTDVRGELPGEGVLRFRVEVTLSDGSVRAFPDTAADPQYTLISGATDELWCERFDDGDPQWAQTTLGTPSPWEWGMPRGMGGDPGAAYSGDSVLGTTLAGDGRYASISETQITTPEISVPTGYAHVYLVYRRWLTVEDALFDRATVTIAGAEAWRNAETEEGALAHYDREWRLVAHEVPAGSTITASWALASDASRAFGGWTLDDVCVVGVRPPAACGNGFVDDGEDCDGDAACSEDCTFVADTGCCNAGAQPPLWIALLLGLRRRRRA